jgi:pyruvate kinase
MTTLLRPTNLETLDEPAARTSAAPVVARQAERRTRIVCTLGPACAEVDTLRRMIEAGMDLARFNFSHGTRDLHTRMAARVRRAAAEAGRRVTLMQDLQGPKLRVGTFPGEGVELATGAELSIVCGAAASAPATIAVPHPALVGALASGHRILFGDGEVELRVIARRDGCVSCEVVHGGRVGDRKGISVPGCFFPTPILTRKDLEDLQAGAEIGFDVVALSFVRTGDDMQAARAAARRCGVSAPLLAKLETQEALWHLDDILAACDEVMVARGDLGVQLPLSRVPAAQKEIIERANRAGVRVTTATQMLESMLACPRPTRAEATDVANAVWDGTDAVMLSGETSAGRYPVEAVRVIAEICVEAEAAAHWSRRPRA